MIRHQNVWHRATPIVAAAIVVLTLAACGPSTTGSAGSAGSAIGSSTSTVAANPTPSAPPTSIATSATATQAASRPGIGLPSGRAITEADNGKTVQYKVGDRFALALRASQGFQDWKVSSPDSRILKPTVNPAAAAARGVTLLAYEAVGAGQTDITATSSPICQPGEACPAIIQSFKVTVTVTT